MASSWFERARRNTNLALNSVFATFIAALLTVCLASTALAERSEQLEGDQQREVPALWQINLGEKRGFLFGSIHFGSDALYPLPTEVMSAFRSVKTLAVEVDIEAVDNAELGQFMSRHGVYPVDESLAAEIGPANWQKSGGCGTDAWARIGATRSAASLVGGPDYQHRGHSKIRCGDR